MLPQKLLRDFDPRRLRLLLALFFVALAVPTAALVWQAWSQLKWEAYYQHRGLAEELTSRIDAELIERINTAEARSFSDYAFVVVSGDPAANFLQRSPLAEFPVREDLPGVVGYFQVDADGTFSTPLLPPEGTPPDNYGITPVELDARRALAGDLARILADNRLIRARPATDDRIGLAAGLSAQNRRVGSVSDGDDKPQASGEAELAERELTARSNELDTSPEPTRQAEKRKDDYSQQVFDELNRAPQAPAAALPELAAAKETGVGEEPAAYRKLADLNIDASLQKKSEALEQKSAAGAVSADAAGAKAGSAGRARRLEQASVPASTEQRPAEALTGLAPGAVPRITTFASEIDPYEFSLLDSGHLVLYRKVWRNGERLIQGILLDSARFLSAAIEGEFRATSLSGMSDLVVAYQDDIVRVIRGEQSSYAGSPEDLQGTLLYRSRLSAPLDRLELVFSINRLPPGPGAGVLLWTSAIIGIVFLTGFAVLYRLGLGQIRLARQQQDFVSAVSHELKTPLTSIRMYGEMLREGWVSDDKRKQYYEYIHDESERLTRLISNVLQLARITRNEPQFDMQAKSIGELLKQVESKIGNQVERAGFRLEILRDAATDAAVIRIDEDCFAQIVINLVDNAVKFSRHAENRKIEIGSRMASGNAVAITVRDFGPGIARDQLKKIFRLFYRPESELTRETVGTGIGLAIVHQLATAMNGKVDVVNKEPGAEFRLAFPLVTQ